MVTPQWRLRVDAGRCIGSGMCAGTAPEHFRLDGNVSTVCHNLADPDQAILDAADQCPVEAIEVLDSVTDEAIDS